MREKLMRIVNVANHEPFYDANVESGAQEGRRRIKV